MRDRGDGRTESKSRSRKRIERKRIKERDRHGALNSLK